MHRWRCSPAGHPCVAEQPWGLSRAIRPAWAAAHHRRGKTSHCGAPRPPPSAAPAAPAAPAAAAASMPGTAPPQAEAEKAQLLELLFETRRGSRVDSSSRGAIEEAQVAVEACSPPELDYSLLEGKWKLLYTTAADVVPILALDSNLLGVLPAPVQVGSIYQRFSSPERGVVQNIIQLGVWPWTREQDGVTFTVEASYEVRSPRRIALTFQEAQLGALVLSPGAEALLAPALLPRGYWNMRLLQAIREFRLAFPFQSAQQVVQGRGVGANYLLTYLDGDMLIGRASGTAGSFVFSREQEE